MIEPSVPNMKGWRCCGCGVLAPDRVKSCDCITNVCRREGQPTEWMRSKAQAACGHLSDVIRTRLLNVHPEDQDVVLDDGDWALILTALEAYDG